MRCRALIQLASLGLLCARAPAAADSLTDAEVYELVFHRKAETVQIPVLLVVERERHGTIVLEQAVGADVQVPVGDLIDALARSGVRLEVRDRLSRAARRSKLPLEELRAAGLDAVFDSRRLELRIGVAAVLTELASHTLGREVPAEAATALRPSALSGYLNMYARGGSASPEHLRLESAFNVRRWVLEMRGELGELPIGAHRGDVLLSRDVPERALRYLAGDFAVGPAGLQPGFPILGVGVTRNFALQPYRVIQPVGAFHFTLERPATVTVLVNGAPVQTLSLPAGRHDVRDLPLAAGANEIELVVREEGSGERRIQFSATNPHELLAPGIVQFSLSLGFPLVEDVGLRSYAWSRPVVSARRRWGVTDLLTVGGAFDGDLDLQVAGAAFTVATRLGNLAADVAASRDAVAGPGHAEGARYDYYRATGGTTVNTLTIAAHYYAPAFRSLAALDVDGRYRGDLSIASARDLGAGIFGRLTGRYQAGRDRPDAYDASVTLSRTFGGLSLDALLGVRDSGSEPRDARMFITANWHLPQRRGWLRATSRTSARGATSSELRYTTAAAAPPGGVVASASLNRNGGAWGGDGTLAYTNDRFLSSVTAATSTGDTGGIAQRAASFEAGTALAFAGGRMAWSRPITGSFAIVDTNDTLSDQMIGVNPAAGSFAARRNRLGPAVVPGLDPYRVGHVRVEAPNLRLGTSLGPGSYALLPSYKSGTVVVVGEPGTVFLRGSLRHPDGTAVAYAVGELVPNDEPRVSRPCVPDDVDADLQHRADCLSERAIGAPRRTSFVLMTNRTGRFSVEGVVPGRYEIRLRGVEPVQINIPIGHAGVFSAGTVRVQIPDGTSRGRDARGEKPSSTTRSR